MAFNVKQRGRLTYYYNGDHPTLSALVTETLDNGDLKIYFAGLTGGHSAQGILGRDELVRMTPSVEVELVFRCWEQWLREAEICDSIAQIDFIEVHAFGAQPKDVNPLTDPQRFHEEQQRVYQEYAQAYSGFFRDCMPDAGVPARFTVHVVDFPDKAAAYEFYSVGLYQPALHGRASGGGRTGEERVFSLSKPEMAMVWIEPGVFQMGSPDPEEGRWEREGPLHEVEISRGFWLGKYAITQGQWEAVMGSNPSTYKGVDRPVTNVSWDAVQEFIGRLNAAAGEALYRLPTEAEWEYACRAGSSTRFSFGDDAGQLRDYTWYSGNNKPVGTKAVGGKFPNAWGLYDMHGNVWEWVQDWYDDSYYNSSPRVDPLGPDTGSTRVVRGGAFNSHTRYLRSAIRSNYSPGYCGDGFGVRLLRIR